MLIVLAALACVGRQPQSYLPKPTNVTFDEARHALVYQESAEELLTLSQLTIVRWRFPYQTPTQWKRPSVTTFDRSNMSHQRTRNRTAKNCDQD